MHHLTAEDAVLRDEVRRREQRLPQRRPLEERQFLRGAVLPKAYERRFGQQLRGSSCEETHVLSVGV